MTSAPISASAILGQALQLYRTHAKAFLVTSAIALLPVFVVHAGLTAAFLPAAAISGDMEARTARIEQRSRELQRRAEAGKLTSEEAAAAQAENLRDAGVAVAAAGSALAGVGLLLLSLVIVVPLMLIGTFFGSAALVPLVDDRAAGGTLAPAAAWARVGQRAVPLLLTAVLAAAAVIIGLFCFVLPGLALGFLFAFAAPVVMLEDLAGPAALKRSARLVIDHLFPTAMVMLALALLSWVARIVGGILIPARFVFMHTLVADLVSLIVFPLPMIGLVLLFREVRGVREQLTPGMSHAPAH